MFGGYATPKLHKNADNRATQVADFHRTICVAASPAGVTGLYLAVYNLFMKILGGKVGYLLIDFSNFAENFLSTQTLKCPKI
jgi:hypothetical protein